MSPQWLGLLLEPLFINQEAGNWPYAFSIHDLGNHYPNATGHNDGMDEMQPLEVSICDMKLKICPNFDRNVVI
jgi:hypothetical protein